MKIYHYSPDLDAYDVLCFAGADKEAGDEQTFEIEIYPDFDWAWRPVRLELEEGPGNVSDFPKLAGHRIPVFSARARECLEDFLAPYVQWFPVTSDFGDFFIVRVLPIIDCLDEQRAEVTRNRRGRIVTYERYALREGVAIDRPIFRIPPELSFVHVTEDFRRQVRKHKFRGLQWNELEYVD